MEEELDEVSVGKGRVQGTRTVSESVLREEARIESEGDVALARFRLSEEL